MKYIELMMTVKKHKVTKQCYAKLENKKRINTDELSLSTLKMMNKSILNFKRRKTSKPIKYKKYN